MKAEPSKLRVSQAGSAPARAANHQANFFAVANGVVDVATNNTVGLIFAAREHPELAARVEAIWSSPPLPQSSVLVRKDLDPALKEKIRQFLITYGTGTGAEADRQREVLKKLDQGGFRPADDTSLDPIREMVAAEADRARQYYNEHEAALAGDALLEAQDRLRAAKARDRQARLAFLPELARQCRLADVPLPEEAAGALATLDAGLRR